MDSLTPYFSGLKEDCFMVKGRVNGKPKGRHVYSEEFRQEAVQMLLDGHSAASVARRLGLSSPTLLYGWKKEIPPPRRPRSADAGRSRSPSRRRTPPRRTRA